MRLECGAILMFGLQFGFEFFHEQFEAADFVSQFLNFCGRCLRTGRGSVAEAGCWRDDSGAVLKRSLEFQRAAPVEWSTPKGVGVAEKRLFSTRAAC